MKGVAGGVALVGRTSSQHRASIAERDACEKAAKRAKEGACPRHDARKIRKRFGLGEGGP